MSTLSVKVPKYPVSIEHPFVHLALPILNKSPGARFSKDLVT